MRSGSEAVDAVLLRPGDVFFWSRRDTDVCMLVSNEPGGTSNGRYKVFSSNWERRRLGFLKDGRLDHLCLDKDSTLSVFRFEDV